MSYYQQGYRPTNEPQRRATSTARRSATNGRSPVQQQRRKPVRKVRRRHPFRTFFLMLLLAVVMCGGIFALIFYQQIQVDENTFYRGVYVDGVSLNGASPQEAHDYLEKRAKTQLGSWSIQLCYGHDLSWKVTPDLLEMQLDVADQINQAWQQGRIGNVLERYQTIIALRATPYYGYTTIRYNEYRLDELLREIKQTVDVQAQDAMQTYIPDRVPPFVYTDEVVGRTLNIENLKAQVLDMVNRLESGEVAIQPDIQQPAVTVAELQGEIVRLSSVRTPIHTTSTPERNRNIEIGCEKFDGKVVKPGAKVSFNDVVGKRTQNNGFQPALEIAYGEYREGIGGGICQCSSTLYNAVVEAGLEIVKRTAHAIPSSYVEKGKDATVSDGGLDLVFRNTTGANIYLKARVEGSGKNKVCIFEVFGRPDPHGYTYKLDATIVEELPIPEVTPIPDKKGEYVTFENEIKEEKKGSVGYRVDVWRVTCQGKQEVARDYLYEDIYKPSAPKVYVGVTPMGDYAP